MKAVNSKFHVYDHQVSLQCTILYNMALRLNKTHQKHIFFLLQYSYF